MKRTLLFASAALAVGMMANAQLVEESTYSPNLTLQWYKTTEGLGEGMAGARAGIGTNGKFYAVWHGDGVYVIEKDKAPRKITSASWVGINCDDAGHVYFRNDVVAFPGAEGMGWFVPGDGRFSVIDSKTDQVIKENVPIVCATTCRFDELPHIVGDMTDGYFEMPVPVNGTAQRVFDFIYQNLDEPNTQDVVYLEPLFNNYPFPGDANAMCTTSQAQCYSIDGVDYMAIQAMNDYNLTYAGAGLGNTIAEFVFDEDEYAYVWTGKWFFTPNRSGVCGFRIFEHAGEVYIIYPSGQIEAGQPSADGFAVMKRTLVDSPENETPVSQEDLDATVAIHFATDGIAGAINYRGINIEPVEGQNGFYTLYYYSPGSIMEVWTLDLSSITPDTPDDPNNGIAGIEADNVAPVYYNLQGVRVDNPVSGMFIEVRGNKAAKVVR